MTFAANALTSDTRPLAKKPNYNFEKHMKEQRRAKKKEEKRLRKLENSRSGAPPDPDLDGDDATDVSDDDAGTELRTEPGA